MRKTSQDLSQALHESSDSEKRFKAIVKDHYALLDAACCENDSATKSTNARTRAAN